MRELQSFHLAHFYVKSRMLFFLRKSKNPCYVSHFTLMSLFALCFKTKCIILIKKKGKMFIFNEHVYISFAFSYRKWTEAFFLFKQICTSIYWFTPRKYKINDDNTKRCHELDLFIPNDHFCHRLTITDNNEHHRLVRV